MISIKSLYQDPLIEHLMSQTEVPLVERPVDARWHYSGISKVGVAGFNPFTGSIYYAKFSLLGDILRGTQHCTEWRKWGAKEAYTALHDYFHVWSIGLLVDRIFGTDVDSRDAMDAGKLTYIYLASEAAATIAVDYWHLCRTSIRDLIGEAVGPLTTPYLENGTDASQHPGLPSVESKAFFHWLLREYCGRGAGADLKVLAHNDLPVESWISRERYIADRQRSFAFGWLLGSGSRTPYYAALNSQLCCDAAQHLADSLWRICFDGALPSVNSFSLHLPARTGELDFRYDSYKCAPKRAACDALSLLQSLSDEQAAYLVFQLLGSLHFDPDVKYEHVFDIILNRDVTGMRQLADLCHEIQGGETAAIAQLTFAS